MAAADFGQVSFAGCALPGALPLASSNVAAVTERLHALIDRMNRPSGAPASALPTCLALLDEMEAALGATARPSLLSTREDRSGGIEIDVQPAAATAPHAFGETLSKYVEAWSLDRKRGLWLRIPLECAACIRHAATLGFAFHHAQPSYVEMTRWLPTDVPSALPPYASTHVIACGVVTHARTGAVLLVQQRAAPSITMQGSWSLPGGLALPGEDFSAAATRVVREATGVATLSTGHGVASLCHAHDGRFGTGELHVVTKLTVDGVDADADDAALRPNQTLLLGARWFTRDELRAHIAPSTAEMSLVGRVSEHTWTVVEQALSGSLIVGTPVAGGASTLYTAPASASLVEGWM